MAVSEYDAFGPWIYEISDRYPVPRLFAPFCQTDEPALLQLKIPREIERRRATPDMDLYDFLLSAYPSRFSILERQADGVHRTEIPYSEIQAIQISREFLKGVLTLYLRSGAVTVPFNTVSMDIMLRLVGLFRERYAAGRSESAVQPPDNLPGELSDILFVNLLRDLRQQGETLTGGAWQPTVPLLYCGGSVLEKLRCQIKKPLLQGALHLATPSELLIIEHEKQTRRDSNRSYGYNYTYVPWSSLKSVEIRPDTDYQGMNSLTLGLTQGTLPFRLEAGNHALADFYRSIRSALCP